MLRRKMSRGTVLFLRLGSGSLLDPGAEDSFLLMHIAAFDGAHQPPSNCREEHHHSSQHPSCLCVCGRGAFAWHTSPCLLGCPPPLCMRSARHNVQFTKITGRKFTYYFGIILGNCQQAPNPPEFAQPHLSRVKAWSSPARGCKSGCVCSYMPSHYVGVR